MRIYGLTGGIASGKSEVARLFRERGIPVIDSDRVGHAVLEPGGPAEAAVREAFGPGIETHGRIDREKLAKRVFSDDAARRRLNGMTHPHIMAAIGEQCRQHQEEGCSAVIIEAALFAEGGKREPWLDGLILVTAPATVRVERLTRCRGMSPEEARARIDAQTPNKAKSAHADWVIVNEGPLAELLEKVDRVAQEMTRHEG